MAVQQVVSCLWVSGPDADIGATAARDPTPTSRTCHSITSGEQRGWDNESNCLRGLQIDAQIKLIGLLNGEIRRPCPAQDSVNAGRTASEQFNIVSAVGQEAAAGSGKRKG